MFNKITIIEDVFKFREFNITFLEYKKIFLGIISYFKLNEHIFVNKKKEKIKLFFLYLQASISLLKDQLAR